MIHIKKLALFSQILNSYYIFILVQGLNFYQNHLETHRPAERRLHPKDPRYKPPPLPVMKSMDLVEINHAGTVS